MSLINEDLALSGIHRAKILEDGDDVRVYVPGITDINPFNSDGSLNSSAYESNKDAFPIALWCAYNKQSTLISNIIEPMWVMFEAGDAKRPVILSYTYIGKGSGEESSEDNSDSSSGSSGSGNSSGSNFSIVGSTTTEKMVSAMKNILKQGYSYGRESGEHDCSSSVSQALVDAGVLSGNGKDYWTGNVKEAYGAVGFKDVTSLVNIKSDGYDNLQPGDILWSDDHMAMYLGNGRISGANSSEGVREINYYDFATSVLRYSG